MFIAMLIGLVPITFMMLWSDGLITSKYQVLTIKALGLWKFIQVKLLKISASVTVVIMNVIIEIILVAMTDYGKPVTVSEKESIIASRLYKLEFFNAGILITFVSYITLNFFGN